MLAQADGVLAIDHVRAAARCAPSPLSCTPREKPFSGTLNLRLGPDLHQRAALSATAHGVSLNSWIKQAVEEKASR